MKKRRADQNKHEDWAFSDDMTVIISSIKETIPHDSVEEGRTAIEAGGAEVRTS